MAAHDWELLATSTDNPYVIAVCEACGRIRRQGAVHDRIIDLRGECPGEPQEPEKRTPPQVRRVGR